MNFDDFSLVVKFPIARALFLEKVFVLTPKFKSNRFNLRSRRKYEQIYVLRYFNLRSR